MVGYLELKAPYDGAVTGRNIDTGHYLAGTGVKPLLGVARTDRVRVFVDIPEADYQKLVTLDGMVDYLARRSAAAQVAS